MDRETFYFISHVQIRTKFFEEKCFYDECMEN